MLDMTKFVKLEETEFKDERDVKDGKVVMTKLDLEELKMLHEIRLKFIQPPLYTNVSNNALLKYLVYEAYEKYVEKVQ